MHPDVAETGPREIVVSGLAVPQGAESFATLVKRDRRAVRISADQDTHGSGGSADQSVRIRTPMDQADRRIRTPMISIGDRRQVFWRLTYRWIGGILARMSWSRNLSKGCPEPSRHPADGCPESSNHQNHPDGCPEPSTQSRWVSRTIPIPMGVQNHQNHPIPMGVQNHPRTIHTTTTESSGAFGLSGAVHHEVGIRMSTHPLPRPARLRPPRG